MITVWVDILTGTWGLNEDLVQLDIPDADLTDDLLDELNDMSDTERIAWALSKAGES